MVKWAQKMKCQKTTRIKRFANISCLEWHLSGGRWAIRPTLTHQTVNDCHSGFYLSTPPRHSQMIIYIADPLSTALMCESKRQYLLILQVSIYCILALLSRTNTASTSLLNIIFLELICFISHSFESQYVFKKKVRQTVQLRITIFILINLKLLVIGQNFKWSKNKNI